MGVAIVRLLPPSSWTRRFTVAITILFGLVWIVVLIQKAWVFWRDFTPRAIVHLGILEAIGIYMCNSMAPIFSEDSFPIISRHPSRHAPHRHSDVFILEYQAPGQSTPVVIDGFYCLDLHHCCKHRAFVVSTSRHAGFDDNYRAPACQSSNICCLTS